MEDLIFVRTLSLKAFMDEENVEKIELRKSQETGKFFFTTDRGVTGKASKTGDVGDDPVVSWCRDGEGDEFWMLHKPTTANIVKDWSKAS